MQNTSEPGVTYFEMLGYKFRFGPDQCRTGDTLKPYAEALVLWSWNAYYWQIELTHCESLEAAKRDMEELIAKRRKALT